MGVWHASLTKTIYVGDSFEIEIPNAFTPNSDGINDAFRPVYFGFTEITLKVFDTWGTLIFIEEVNLPQCHLFHCLVAQRQGEFDVMRL